MSANRNPDSLQVGGHKPGVLVGNDKIPEFHAETYPPGIAPRENTFQPQPVGEFSAEDAAPNVADTLEGATSQDVHQGMGKPLQGQEAREINKRHGGNNKKSGTGLAGVGSSQGVDSAREKGADLPEGVHRGMKGKGNDDYPAAEDRLPTSAAELGSERK